MKIGIWPMVHRQSLSRQIQATACRLDQRSARVSALAHSMRSMVRQALVSPRGLLIAGGTGFIVAEWMDRSEAPGPLPSDEPRPDQGRLRQRLIPSVVLLTRFVLELKSRWERLVSSGATAHR